METTVDFAELVERARSADDHVPEGWVQTDNLEVIPDVETGLVVNFATVDRKTTRTGYPRIMVRALEPESGLSFFENINWSHSDEGNKITLQTLTQLGVPSSVVDAGIDAIVEHLEDSWHYAYIKEHNQRDFRTFPRIVWNKPMDGEAGEVAELVSAAKTRFTTGEIVKNDTEVEDDDLDW